MKRIIWISVFALAFLGASLVLAQEAATTPAGDVAHDVGAVIDAVRSGSAIAIAAAIIMLLTTLFKAPWLGGLVKKIPKRWRIAIPIILGGVAGILSSIVGGMPWLEALMVGLFSGPTAVFAHEAVVEAILGQSKSRNSNSVS
jgi:hypothetical protein